jgi:hypothetical protein
MFHLATRKGKAPKLPYYCVEEVKPLADYHLWLRFADGKTGVYNFKPQLDGRFFAPLHDSAVFNSVEIDGDSIAWQKPADANPTDWPWGMIDFAPETLYDGCAPA